MIKDVHQVQSSVELKISREHGLKFGRCLGNAGFPLEFYSRGHVSPLTLILKDIWSDFGGHLDWNILVLSKFWGTCMSPSPKCLGDI